MDNIGKRMSNNTGNNLFRVWNSCNNISFAPQSEHEVKIITLYECKQQPNSIATKKCEKTSFLKTVIIYR